MKKIVSLLSHPVTFATAVAVFSAFMLIVVPGESRKAEAYTPEGVSFDLNFFYPPKDVYPAVEAYGDTGRAAYVRSRLTFDLAFPLVYTLFSLSGAAFFLRRLGAPSMRLLLIPLAGMIFDFIENTAVSVMMANWPDQIVLLPWVASAATLLKWLFVVPGMILPFILAILYLLRRKRN